MASFADALSNPNYIQGFTLITTGSVKGLLYVESKNDIGFWRYLIEHIYPKKYEVKPAAKLKADGKKTLEKEYSKLNSMCLVGIDSDMDYLCPSRSQYSSELNSNPYVLHTFSYSKESFQCSIESIEDITARLVFKDEFSSEIIDALMQFSGMIYEALLIHLYRHNKNPELHEDGLLWKNLKLSGNASIINALDLKINSDAIDSIKAKIDAFLAKYAITSAEKQEFENFVTDTKQKGLSQETAYQFIKGHVLHDTYVYPALKIIRDKHFKTEKRKIGIECNSKEKEDERNARFGELDNFYLKNNVLETMINNNLNYTSCSLYIKVQDKIRAIP
jgi:hypothetical protein